jgi:hypothetical protein
VAYNVKCASFSLTNCTQLANIRARETSWYCTVQVWSRLNKFPNLEVWLHKTTGKFLILHCWELDRDWTNSRLWGCGCINELVVLQQFAGILTKLLNLISASALHSHQYTCKYNSGAQIQLLSRSSCCNETFEIALQKLKLRNRNKCEPGGMRWVLINSDKS